MPGFLPTVSSHGLLSECAERERAGELFGISSNKDTYYTGQSPTLMTSSIISFQDPSPNTTSLEVRASINGFGQKE